jgi:hypothetical protein
MSEDRLHKYIEIYRKAESYFDKFFEGDKGCGCCAWDAGEIYFDQFFIKFLNKCIEEDEKRVVTILIEMLFQYLILYIKPVIEKKLMSDTRLIIL